MVITKFRNLHLIYSYDNFEWKLLKYILKFLKVTTVIYEHMFVRELLENC